MLLKEMNQKHGKVPWGMFYFHRYWRLTPVFAFVMLVYTMLTPYMIRGPFQYLYRETKTDLCVNYWWTNLLYINNFYPTSSEDQCMGWSWFLANDMQFYIITPLIVLLYRLNRKLGWSVVGILSLGCFAVNVGLVHVYQLHALNPSDNQFNSIDYNKPYARIGTYLIGVATAFMLQEDTDYTANPYLRWAGYLLAAASTTSNTYSTYTYWRSGWSNMDHTLYIAFSRPGFVLGIAFPMYAIMRGHGGVLRELLSLYIWVPLARLTYTAYLTHPIIIFVINYSSTTVFHYSAINMAIRYAAHLVLAYSVGLVFHLVLEKPTANLERIIFPRRRH